MTKIRKGRGKGKRSVGKEKANQLSREQIIRFMEERVRGELAKPDIKLVVAVHTRDQIISVINLLYERMEEWADILNIDINDTSVKDRIKKMAKYLDKAKGGKINNESLNEEDIDIVYPIVKQMLSLLEYKNNLNEYIEELTNKCCPNVKALVGSDIAAQLVTLAGGVEKLALFPSGTVQLLGAEKALFRHLKSGAKPPKYGILYKHPIVMHAPKNKKGRVARIIATHISIAARADAFTKNNIGTKLKNDLDKKIAKILRK